MKVHSKVSRSFAIVLVGAFVLALLPLAEDLIPAGSAIAQENGGMVRTWTDASGTRTIEAEFLTFKDSKVHLKKSDGTEIAISMNAISKADQEFVRQELAKRRGANSASGTKKSVPGKELAGSAQSAGGDSLDWPQWRGPNRDGISQETGLLSEWPDNGPPLLWKIEGLGRGFSSVAVSQGKIFTMGQRNRETVLIALKESNGELLWSTPAGKGDRPNCTPTVDRDLVFSVSHGGDLVCANTQSGAVVWNKNFENDFGGEMMSHWGYSESPLVDGDRLICTPGGSRAVLAALDKQSGKVVWTTPMPNAGSRGKDGAAYSSIVISNAGGVKQYVQLVGRGLISVDAKTGQPLWTYNRIANDVANIPTPIVKGDLVFCATGYETGSALLKLSGERGGRVSMNEVYFLPPKHLQNHHGGMILLGDFVYCGHGHNKGFPACLNLQTGKRMWEDNIRGEGSGSAAITYADGHLYFRYQSGMMVLIEANPRAYKVKGKFEIPSKQDESWPHPVIANGRMYLRDQDALLCYDLRKK